MREEAAQLRRGWLLWRPWAWREPELGNADRMVPMNWMRLCKPCAVEFGLPDDAECEMTW